ncbi:MAG TPA: CheR family methyltransferase [Methylomirabilota bacterium]|nr:CheR family methyltransferase [Methylomirabilota bacterium]
MTAERANGQFEALLDYLQRTRGFDFAAYKPPSLMRRIQKRMQTVGLRDFADYQDHLEVHPEEFPHLFNTILINVTAFFRDPPAWDYLAADILPPLLERKGSADPIRVWSAGCASGEEAYTLAMVLAEKLGLEGLRRRVKIYATDVDEEALSQARQATYSAGRVEDVPTGLREKYFEHANGRYGFHKELRRSVIFGRHDLLQDAPISRVDLLVSRNTLMYFNSEAQGRILGRFHFALNGGGYLFLGKAELLLTHADLFVPVDLKRRVFVKVPRPEARARPPRPAAPGGEGHDDPDETRMRDLVFEADPTPQLVVDASGALALANERARALLGIAPTDVWRPFQELEAAYRPTDLRAVTEQALADRRPVLLHDVHWPRSAGDARYFDILATPLLGGAGGLLGVRVTFTDVSRYKRLQDELHQSRQELETAYEEVQSSNEELETTNEELQSSNEELETTNEELQSTNEELETMNEELQSTNEELETINTELRERTEELKGSTAFLGSILESLRAGVVVVDRDIRVLAWNDGAEDLWGVRPHEAKGRHFLNLDIGLPAAELLQPIRACLSGEAPHSAVTLEATNRRGRRIQCLVDCTPLLGSAADIQGAILLMEPRDDGR